jgi:hypothetical protein
MNWKGLGRTLSISRPVVLKHFWFAAHCKTYTNFLAHFVYKNKNILIYFKLWIKFSITFLIFAAHLATSCGAPFENHWSRLYGVEWYDDWWMRKNLEGGSRDLIEILFRHLPLSNEMLLLREHFLRYFGIWRKLIPGLRAVQLPWLGIRNPFHVLHTNTHTRNSTHACTQTHRHVHTQTHTSTHTFIRTRVHADIWTQTRTHIYSNTQIYTHR